MSRSTAITLAAITTLALAGCSNSGSSNSGDEAPAKANAAASKPLTATTAFTKLSAAVKTAKLSGTVTAANDPDHLLGRPNQYTSKVTFSDSRIKASDVAGTSKGDVTRGGEIEVFADAASAEARAKYIEAVTKSMPALAEYDYVHGAVLVRVSMLLTPAQAGGYKSAAAGLG